MSRVFAQGLVAIGILAGVIPFLVLQSLVPILADGIDLWIGSFVPVIGASLAMGSVIAVGLRRRGLWFSRFVAAAGWILLFAFGCGLILDLVISAHLIPEVSPDLSFINIINLIAWVLICPLAWLVFRLLRTSG